MTDIPRDDFMATPMPVEVQDRKEVTSAVLHYFGGGSRVVTGIELEIILDCLFPEEPPVTEPPIKQTEAISLMDPLVDTGATAPWPPATTPEPFRCRHDHKAPAVGYYSLPNGCPCFDDREQWLCAQHVVKLQNNGYPVVPIYENPKFAAERTTSLTPQTDRRGRGMSSALAERVAWKILCALHKNTPEDQRPQSWSDVSSDQEPHIFNAANAAIQEVAATYVTMQNDLAPAPQAEIDALVKRLRAITELPPQGWNFLEVYAAVREAYEVLSRSPEPGPAVKAAMQRDNHLSIMDAIDAALSISPSRGE